MGKILKFIGYLLAVVIVAPLTLALALKVFSNDVAPPGKLVDVGGYKLHINCQGPDNDLPTVVVEAGAGTDSPAYYWLHQTLAETGKVCLYDRAGLGWSEESNLPRDSKTIANALHTLLEHENIKRPFVFAGHSIAGIHMRVYNDLYPNDVAGVVFLDASHPRQNEVLDFGDEESEDMESVNAILRLYTQLGFTRLYNPAYWPNDSFPLEVQEQFQGFSHSTKGLDASDAEYKAFDESMKQALSTRSFEDKPITVITATEPIPAYMFPEGTDLAKIATDWLGLQKDIATLSSNSNHVSLETANHMSLVMSKENAEVVAGHVRDMVLALGRTQSVMNQESPGE